MGLILNNFSCVQIPIRLHILVIVLLNLSLSQCSQSSNRNIIISNNSYSYEIGYDGTNVHFTDKATSLEYLDTGQLSKCAFITTDGKRQDVTAVELNKNHLILEFGDTEIKAIINVSRAKDHIKLKVASVNGDIESLTFLNIPLKLEGMPYEPFGACALSMNLYTHVRQIPALQTDLWATCYKKFGLEGAEVSLIGLPTGKMVPEIRSIMENAKDIPFSDKGGAWALTQKEGYGSYLMNFGTLTEEMIDEWISNCRRLGFNQIDNHGGRAFFKYGDFQLDKSKWPDEWETFRRINKKLHEAGLSSILHTYAFFIDKTTKYVTPVPRSDLAYFRSFTLSRPLDSTGNEIEVIESTANVSTITGFFVRNSVTLRIGEELIEFSGVTNAPPYKFTGCKRGTNGTKASAHKEGAKAYHLKEMFTLLVPDPDSPLFDEIARRTAEIVNECDFDGLYFDAIDGSDILGGEENTWYYGTKFIFEVAKNLEHPVGMEMSSMFHQWWHYRSRWQAWDRPNRGYKRFIDIHSAAIKSTRLFLPPEIRSNENEHGLWRGHAPLIDKYSAVENGGLLLPLHFGWWGNQTWNPPQVEPTFSDDVEYLCCKMIGNNAGLSMLSGVDEKTLKSIPLFARLTEMIRQYEELRHQNYFSDSIRILLRQPGKEFTLFKEESGRWNFRPVSYNKHKVAGVDHPSSKWVVNNQFASQAVKLRIEPLMSVRSFNDPGNVVLAGFSKPDEFKNTGSAGGISGGMKASSERPEGGGKGGLFYASSDGSLPVEGSWIRMEKEFEPWLNISKNQGLGVWVKGDGNGQLLNLRLESPKHLSFGAHGDHFVKIDFTGWKYFELVEIESSEYSNYIWPDSGFFVYDSYRHRVNFENVNKLQIWYNNIPAGKEVNCVIGTVKALPLVSVSIKNPEIRVGDESVVFPVTMDSGMYLEFMSENDCKLFGSKGEFIQDVKVEGKIPVLKQGDNAISFTCKGPEGISSRVQVTVIAEGEPL